MNDDQIAEARELIEKERQVAYTQRELDEAALGKLEDTLAYLRSTKPNERSELARRYAVTITELEKVFAYFRIYVARQF